MIDIYLDILCFEPGSLKSFSSAGLSTFSSRDLSCNPPTPPQRYLQDL